MVGQQLWFGSLHDESTSDSGLNSHNFSALLVFSKPHGLRSISQPGIGPAFAAHQASYTELIVALAPGLVSLQTELAAVVDQATYEALLNHSNTIAANGTLSSGRVVVTLPDGTVVLDTNRDDNTGAANSNSYAHFQAKTINENHNSRVAFLAPQLFECGVAVETKTSTSTGDVENYVGFRLGAHLDSKGTVRISQVQ